MECQGRKVTFDPRFVCEETVCSWDKYNEHTTRRRLESGGTLPGMVPQISYVN